MPTHSQNQKKQSQHCKINNLKRQSKKRCLCIYCHIFSELVLRYDHDHDHHYYYDHDDHHHYHHHHHNFNVSWRKVVNKKLCTSPLIIDWRLFPQGGWRPRILHLQRQISYHRLYLQLFLYLYLYLYFYSYCICTFHYSQFKHLKSHSAAQG